MKKVLVLSFVALFALVLSHAVLADESAAKAAAAVPAVDQVVNNATAPVGVEDGCGPVMPGGCGPVVQNADCCGQQVQYARCAPCRPFLRRACTPCFANPCNPCNSYAQPACTAPVEPACAAPACGASYGCEANYGCGYAAPAYGNACGGYGSGYACRTPIRNIFQRLFAPRACYGYDSGACGGYGYGNSCGSSYGYGNSCGCSTSYGCGNGAVYSNPAPVNADYVNAVETAPCGCN